MSFLKRIFFVSTVFALVATTGIMASGAQEEASDYPTKPINLIVPANPGGGTDLGARLLAEYLTTELDNPVVVVNMVGASGSLAQDHVLDSDPDGYNILYFHEAFVANRVHGLTETTLKDDFVTVGGAYIVDTVCLYSKEFETWDEMISVAKERTVIQGGEVAAAYHIAFEAMRTSLGMRDNFRFVDTGAVTPSLAAIEGGQIDMSTAPMGVIRDSVQEGHLNVLAFFSSDERSEFAPEIPTMQELGADVLMPKFYFMAMTPGTPQERAEILRQALKNVTKDPEFIKEAKDLFYKPGYLSPEEIYRLAEINYDFLSKYSDRIKE